jgi:transposase
MPTKIGDIAIKIHLKELQDIQNSIAEVLREIRELSRTPKYEKNVELLMTVPGVGEITSMIIATELCDINRFGNFKHLNGYVGLVPSEDSSGDEIKKGPINHRGNKILRTKLIESAWVAVRKDSALIQTFQKLSKRMKKCKAIIIIAKKLLSRIFFVLKNQKKYINGIVVDKA